MAITVTAKISIPSTKLSENNQAIAPATAPGTKKCQVILTLVEPFFAINLCLDEIGLDVNTYFLETALIPLL